MLLGAWSVGGVRNLLAITGDPPSLGDHPETSGVYEIDSIGLVKVAARLNQGTDWAGKTLGGATNYTIGVALNPTAEDLDYEIRRFYAKVEAGAHFAMTQPLFDPAHWEAFLKRIGGKSPVPDRRGDMAAYQLQASLAAQQRSAGHLHSRAGLEGARVRRGRRPRSRVCPGAPDACLGALRGWRSLPDSALQDDTRKSSRSLHDSPEASCRETWDDLVG